MLWDWLQAADEEVNMQPAVKDQKLPCSQQAHDLTTTSSSSTHLPCSPGGCARASAKVKHRLWLQAWATLMQLMQHPCGRGIACRHAHDRICHCCSGILVEAGLGLSLCKSCPA